MSEGNRCYKVALVAGDTLVTTLIHGETDGKRLKQFRVWNSSDWSEIQIEGFQKDSVADFIVGSDGRAFLIQELNKVKLCVLILDLVSRCVLHKVDGQLDREIVRPVMRLVYARPKTVVMLIKSGLQKTFPRAHVAASVDLSSGNVSICSSEENPGSGDILPPARTVFCIAPLTQDSMLIGCHGDALLWQLSMNHCSFMKSGMQKVWLRHSLCHASRLRKSQDDGDRIPVTSLVISHDSSLVATAADNGGIVVWKNSDGTQEETFKRLKGHKATVSTWA